MDKERGVSPVVSIILLTGVTVMIVAVASLTVFDIGSSGSGVSNVQSTVTADSGFEKTTVRLVRNPSDADIIVRDEEGNQRRLSRPGNTVESSTTGRLNPVDELDIIAVKNGNQQLLRTVSPALEVLFNLSKASYTGQSFYVGDEDPQPRGFEFSEDGTQLFVIGLGADMVYAYALEEPYNITTASYTGNSFSIKDEERESSGIDFGDNGSKMYIIGYDNDSIHSYNLDAQYDITTASYTGNTVEFANKENYATDMLVSDGGEKLFIVGEGNGRIYSYTLDTAFDLTTASDTGASFNVSQQDEQPSGLAVRDDGETMYVVGYVTNSVYSYEMSEDYNVNSLEYSGRSLNVSEQTTRPSGLLFNTESTKLFVVGIETDSDEIYTYKE